MALKLTQENVEEVLSAVVSNTRYDDWGTWSSIREGNANYLSNADKMAERFNIPANNSLPSIPVLRRIMLSMASHVSTAIPAPTIETEDEEARRGFADLWDDAARPREMAMVDAIGFGIGWLVLVRDEAGEYKLRYAPPPQCYGSQASGIWFWLEPSENDGREWSNVPQTAVADTHYSVQATSYVLHGWQVATEEGPGVYIRMTKDGKEEEVWPSTIAPVMPVITNEGVEGINLRKSPAYTKGIALQQALDVMYLAMVSGMNNVLTPKWWSKKGDGVKQEDLQAFEEMLIESEAPPSLLPNPNVQGDVLVLQQRFEDQMYGIYGVNKLLVGAFTPTQQMSGYALQLLWQQSGAALAGYIQAAVSSVRNIARLYVEAVMEQRSQDVKIDITADPDATAQMQYQSILQLQQMYPDDPRFKAMLVRYNPFLSAPAKDEISNMLDQELEGAEISEGVSELRTPAPVQAAETATQEGA